MMRALLAASLLAAAAATPGAALWSTLTPSWVLGSPAVGSDGTVYATSESGVCTAFDGTSGVPLWSFQSGFSSLAGPVVVNQAGLVLFVSGDGNVYALSTTGGGSLLWKTSLLPSPGPGDAPIVASPVLSPDGSLAYVGTATRSGAAAKLFALVVQNGTVAWSVTLPPGSVVGKPAVSPTTGAVFVGLSTGTVVALNTTGGRIWLHEAGAGVTGPVAFGASTVLVGTTGGTGVVAIFALSGAPIWSYVGPAASDPTLTPFVTFSSDGGAGGTGAGIAYASMGNTVAALFTAANGGKLAWPSAWTAPAQVLTAPAVSAGRVYVGCDDGCLYALNGTVGTPLWSSCTGGMVRSSPTVGPGFVAAGSLDQRVWAWALE
jgi:outer membrane protein assembly factor BamB